MLARDIKTGRQTVVEVKSAVDVDDAEVQKMVEQSVEHAFEDFTARRWIEAKLRAQETIAATRKGLVQCAGAIDVEYKAKVEATLKAVEDLLAVETSDPQSEDVATLKAALASLDGVTQALADLMMDKAMEALLRKRGSIQ